MLKSAMRAILRLTFCSPAVRITHWLRTCCLLLKTRCSLTCHGPAPGCITVSFVRTRTRAAGGRLRRFALAITRRSRPKESVTRAARPIPAPPLPLPLPRIPSPPPPTSGASSAAGESRTSENLDSVGSLAAIKLKIVELRTFARAR